MKYTSRWMKESKLTKADTIAFVDRQSTIIFTGISNLKRHIHMCIFIWKQKVTKNDRFID